MNMYLKEQELVEKFKYFKRSKNEYLNQLDDYLNCLLIQIKEEELEYDNIFFAKNILLINSELLRTFTPSRVNKLKVLSIKNKCLKLNKYFLEQGYINLEQYNKWNYNINVYEIIKRLNSLYLYSCDIENINGFVLVEEVNSIKDFFEDNIKYMSLEEKRQVNIKGIIINRGKTKVLKND